MIRQSLNGTWRLQVAGHEACDMEVPGCIETVIEEKNIGDAFTVDRIFTVNEVKKNCYLRFGAVSYYCDIHLNDQLVGSHEGMWDAFHVDVAEYIKEGENTLSLTITKPGYKDTDRFPNREVLSGFIHDTSTTFGGIWDDVDLILSDGVILDTVVVQGDANGHVDVRTEILGDVDTDVEYMVEIADRDGSVVAKYEGQLQDAISLQVEDATKWDTAKPYLYTYKVAVRSGNDEDVVEGEMGFRTISYEGPKLILNGNPTYIRGLLHWGYYDDIIIPNPAASVIAKEIKGVKEYGYNSIKHCLYIPREEYLKQADQEGMLLWIELPLWLIVNTPELEGRIRREYPRILKQLAGHPSVVLISLGCELDDSVNACILEDMYKLTKDMTSALVRDNSGSGECYGGLPIDFADFHDYHFYGDLQNMEHLVETFTPRWRGDRPFLYGEFNENDTLRDMEEVRQAKGVDCVWWELSDPDKNPICTLKPDFYMGFHEEHMNKYGVRDEYPYLKALSYDHGMVVRKMNLEFTRGFSQIAGYNVTSIRDIPIATSGYFDDMGRPKFDKDIVRMTNDDVVLVPAWDLSRIWVCCDKVYNMERFNFYSGSTYSLHLLCSNYSGASIEQPTVRYEILDGDNVILSKEITSEVVVSDGELKKLLYIREQLPEVDAPKTLIMKVTMGDVVNCWPIFMYEKCETSMEGLGVYDPANIFADYLKDAEKINDEEKVEGYRAVVTSRLTPSIKQYAKEGGKVFYVQRGEGAFPAQDRKPFWRESFSRSYDHPILEGMDKSSWMEELRYFSVSAGSAFKTLEMAEEYEVTPILRRYDTRQWDTHEYMMEVSYGEGTIIATTLRLEGGDGKEPFSFTHNLFSKWILDRAIKYMTKA